VAGLHFFNPVHKMQLVEVVRAPQTEEGVVATLNEWAAAVGKIPVTVRDSPGFLVNRIFMPYINEAGVLVSEGMPVEAVDRVMRRFGMIMGPLRSLDEVGLDVAAHIARSVGPVFGQRLNQQAALDRMVQAGWLGKKSGKGFYVYGGKKPVANTEALAALRAEFGGAAGASWSAERVPEARDRMVFLAVNEAAACLGEGLSDRAEVIDLAMVLGTGWAPHRGGPLRYADDFGPAKVVQTLDDLARRLGERFAPCAELRQRAKDGQPFYHLLSLPQPV
jgi:3-hydroxyacyl-CoA dehydrogenase/enoyl-CoA hydratase/3-hydroxybutyryl-CoA epimerase